MTEKPTYEELEKRIQVLVEDKKKYQLISETIVSGIQGIDILGK